MAEKPRILYIEDDPSVSGMGQIAVGMQGVVTFYESCDEALAALLPVIEANKSAGVTDPTKLVPFDLAVTDVSMAGTTGYEFLRRLKAEGVELKAVVLSSHVPGQHDQNETNSGLIVAQDEISKLNIVGNIIKPTFNIIRDLSTAIPDALNAPLPSLGNPPPSGGVPLPPSQDGNGSWVGKKGGFGRGGMDRI